MTTGMSRSSIIVALFRAADDSKTTPLSRKRCRFYFTIVKYNMNASFAQAGGKNPCGLDLRAPRPDRY
jgi:hypothetical protein